LFKKMTAGLASAEVRRAHVQVEARVPRLGGERGQWAHAGAAGVIDEDVDAAELVDRALHQPDDLLFDLDVGWHG
jgi:hypothetical protein